ncbi:MAG: glutamyl-tRNA reductase [Spirochaetota bacterium]|nr:glutamyl-tRNA reductase [Spirochaetota bacterium]
MDNQNGIPEIILIGMSHKTAPVKMREHFSLANENISEFLLRLCSCGIKEAVCISTCNRVEVYVASHDIKESVDSVLEIFEEISSLKRDDFEDSIYKKYSKEAILHLLTVASSLDSMVVGENEIIGQVKEAYRKSSIEKCTGQILNRLFHQAFNTAKRVRTETEIAKNPLSVAYIATELAKSIFEDISQKKALLVGAGEMGELILKYLTKCNIGEVIIANRSFHNAERIANNINREARIITLEDIRYSAAEVDIIISSVLTPEYMITPITAKSAIKRRGNQPLFMIDIAVPRSIEPEVGRINNVFLYNIDDLKSIADENLKSRLREVELAESLIELDAEEFYEWYEGLVVVPTIVKIQDKFDEIRKKELNKYKRRKLKHVSDEDFQLIEELTNQIMTKTLHNPIVYLKNHVTDGRGIGGHEKRTIRDKIRIIEELLGT